MEIVKSAYPRVVEEIHKEFMSAGDLLLEKANKIIAESIVVNEEKANKLNALGFSSTKEAALAMEVISKKEQQNKVINAIYFFNINYPNYKFISEEIAKKICEKYGLVLGVVSQYKGFVPQKNLDEIEKFFEAYPNERKEYVISYHSNYGSMVYQVSELTYNHYLKQPNASYFPKIRSTILNICAPIKDMEMKGYSKQGHLLVKDVPDPIVLKSVEHNEIKGFLILTAWGDEATDELVVNQAQN